MAQTKRNKPQEQRKRTMQEAAQKMDALAKKLGKWDPQTTIRKFRDANLKSGS